MVLVFDIGNTNTKIARFEDFQNYSFDIVPTKKDYSTSLFNGHIDEVVICSVVPQKTAELIGTSLLKSFELGESINSTIISSEFDLGIEITYKTPLTLGTDRICSVVGAMEIEKSLGSKSKLIISIDCGTATTINVLYDKTFLGGLIAPGLNTMFDSLNKNTSQLPQLDLSFYKDIIGDDTNSSIASGVLHAASGFIEKSLNIIEDKFIEQPFVCLTGGNSKSIMEKLNREVFYDEHLVLKGAYKAYLNSKLNK